MTVKGVESRLEKALFPFLKNESFFKKHESIFEKKIDYGAIFSISFNVKGYPPNDFSVQTMFSVKIEEIDKYWMKYRASIDNDRNPYPYFISFLIFDFMPKSDMKYHTTFDGKPRTSFGEGRETIKTEEDINLYLKKFKSEYNNLVVPFINKAIHFEWIDKELNGDYLNFKLKFFTRHGLVFRKLIVAKLVKNPKFEEMFQAFRERWIGWLELDKFKNDVELIKKHIIVLEKVYNDLK